MNLLLKHSQKLISYEFSNGLLFSSLCQKLKNSFPLISFSDQDLLEKLTANSLKFQLIIDAKASDRDPKLISEKALIDKFTKQDILRLFISEDDDKREVIISIYELIIKSKENGISYVELNKKLKKLINVNLEINMISHYCRKLATCNLVEINSTKTCKIVICKIFTPITLKKNIHKSNETNGLFEKKEEGNVFNFRELTFKQNVLINLMSAEANLKNGLSLIELGERIGKPKETKMLNRYLSKMEKIYNIQIKPERQGRLYSYKYLIENPEIKKLLKIVQNEPKINNKKTGNDGVKIEEENKSKIQDIVACEMKKQETYILNNDCFKDLIVIFAKNQEYSDFLKKVMEPDLFHDFLSLKNTKEKKSRLEIEKENKLIKNMNISSSKEIKSKYEILTENMIKILIEKIEFDMIKKQKTFNNNNKSKKQVSSLKINRYIFSLNEIYQEKILPVQNLKHKLIDLELKYGIGKIDRKTILFMLESLEAIGLIKLVYKDLGNQIKNGKCKEKLKNCENSSINNFFKQNKNIIILDEIPENDVKIEEMVKDFINKNSKDNTEKSTKTSKLQGNSKKILKTKKTNGKLNFFKIKQEHNLKIEKIWNEQKNYTNDFNTNFNKTFSFIKVSDVDMKRNLLGKTLNKITEKIKSKHLKFSWKKLVTNMELLSLQEVLKKITVKEEPRDNFVNFSIKFDKFNKYNFHDRLFDLYEEKTDFQKQNYNEILEEIDEKIDIYESSLEIEEEKMPISRNYPKYISENRRKNERNVEKIKQLLIKYPIKKMKDIETQLNNINYMDLIWKELYRNDLIRIFKIDENGVFMENDEMINFGQREDYYYKINEKFYDYI